MGVSYLNSGSDWLWSLGHTNRCHKILCSYIGSRRSTPGCFMPFLKVKKVRWEFFCSCVRHDVLDVRSISHLCVNYGWQTCYLLLRPTVKVEVSTKILTFYIVEIISMMKASSKCTKALGLPWTDLRLQTHASGWGKLLEPPMLRAKLRYKFILLFLLSFFYYLLCLHSHAGSLRVR